MPDINTENQRKDLLLRWKRPKKTPVIFTDQHGQAIAIKDENKNLTDTFKAKHGWMMGRHYLENIFPEKFIYYLGSTGNSGIADLAYADMLNDMLGEGNVQVVNFYPKHYDHKLLGPDSNGLFSRGNNFRKQMPNL